MANLDKKGAEFSDGSPGERGGYALLAHAEIGCGTCSFCAERPEIHFDLCERCGTCATFCHHHVFHKDNTGHFVANLVLCVGCGTCAKVCPAGAIEMVHIHGMFTHG